MANKFFNFLTTKLTSLEGRMDSIEDSIEILKEVGGYFRPFDARKYINYPLSEYSKIWKYRSNYYSNKKDLYEVAAANNDINITYEVFLRKFTEDSDLWKYKINTVYLYKLTIPYYISTDGIFFTDNYAPLSTIGAGGETKIMMDGQFYILRCGYYTYRKFVDRDYTEVNNNIFYLVPGFKNSRVDVLSPHKDAATTPEIE